MNLDNNTETISHFIPVEVKTTLTPPTDDDIEGSDIAAVH
jgi:hypothetical protein